MGLNSDFRQWKLISFKHSHCLLVELRHPSGCLGGLQYWSHCVQWVKDKTLLGESPRKEGKANIPL